jgi:Flp pilus assembly protein TadG
MRLFRRRRDEEGAALIETALVLSVLLMIAFGAFEYGMALRDWLSVTQSAREGVRLAAVAGNHTNADCQILEATAGALLSLDGGTTRQVWIYESDTSGTVGAARQRYRPASSSDTSNLLNCSTSTWVRLQNSWPASSRDNSGATRDWIGIRIMFEYDWITDFLFWNGTVNWSDDAVMHMEPTVDF